MISAVDEAIGQITAALDEQGIRTNTLIIFSSDNGGPGPGRVSLNTPLRAGKGTIYEGGVRVCAFATWPGRIPAGTTNREPMHAVDWYPTLLNLAGASSKQKLTPDGLDLAPTLTRGAKSPHDAILLVGNSPAKAAVRMGDWKLLVNATDKGDEAAAETNSRETVELYNLADDVSESKNLAASQPEKVKQLRARLHQFLKNAVPSGNEAATKRAAGTVRRPQPRGVAAGEKPIQ
jgi:arylsulfatase A-like enzyme